MSRVLRCFYRRLAVVALAGLVSLAGSVAAPVASRAAARDGAPLDFSTYLGGSGYDNPQAVAVDGCGDVYVAGYTASRDFPSATGEAGPLSTFHGGDGDAFVTKIAADGKLLYTAFVGGSGVDTIMGLAVDAGGVVYVTGFTESSDFPATSTIGVVGHRSAFVAKLDPSGRSLVYATRFGGSGATYGSAVAVDAEGNAYVTGATESYDDFPTAGPGAARSTKAAGSAEGGDAFVAKLAPDGASLVYARRFGGGLDDLGEALAVDPTGAVVVAGATVSYDFPSVAALPNPAPDTPGEEVAFVTKVSPDGGAIVYSTRVPHTFYGLGVGTDTGGNAYVTGISRFDFATTANPFSVDDAGLEPHAFLVKLPPAGGSLDYAIEVGGRDGDGGSAVAVDATGRVYLAGYTSSRDFPNRPPGRGGDVDAFVVRIGADGATLELATTIGGSRSEATGPKVAMGVNAAGTFAIAGNTLSTDFPMKRPLRTTLAGPSDGYVAAFAGDGVAPPAVASAHAVTKPGKPLRVDLSGSGFEVGTLVYIGDDAAPWPTARVRGCSSIRLKGAGLDAAFPVGTPVPIRIANPSGAETTFVLTR